MTHQTETPARGGTQAGADATDVAAVSTDSIVLPSYPIGRRVRVCLCNQESLVGRLEAVDRDVLVLVEVSAGRSRRYVIERSAVACVFELGEVGR